MVAEKAEMPNPNIRATARASGPTRRTSLKKLFTVNNANGIPANKNTKMTPMAIPRIVNKAPPFFYICSNIISRTFENGQPRSLLDLQEKLWNLEENCLVCFIKQRLFLPSTEPIYGLVNSLFDQYLRAPAKT